MPPGSAGGPRIYLPTAGWHRTPQIAVPIPSQPDRTVPNTMEDLKYTVVYPPTINYDYMKQRPQHLMEQFAADGHRVYYINLWERDAPPLEVRQNLVVLQRAADIVRMPLRRPVVLWMSWSETADWIDRIQPDISVYDCLDDFPEWSPAEHVIVPRVDLVTASSDPLLAKMRKRHPRVVLVRNACEYDRFSDLSAAPDPPDWPQLDPGLPVVGYMGALGYWLDAQLIARIAEHYEMVLIGPGFGHQHVNHRRVHYLGLRPYEALPGYLKRMHVLTIPFVDSPLTRATNPVKMYEYLATGKPVVATAIPETERMPLLKVGRTPEEFLQLLAEAAREDGADQSTVAVRQAVARANSWRVRYELVRDAIDAVWREKARV